MGIDGPDWEGSDRRAIRKRIIGQIGSNKFRIGMFTYSPGGQATNYVVIFKIERGVSLTHA